MYEPCPRHAKLAHGCPGCRPSLVAATAAVAKKTGAHVRVGGSPVSVRVPLATAARCPFEGPVVEACTSCNKTQAETRHVRLCGHPAPTDPDREKCHRVAIPGSPHQACDTCVDHPKNAPKPVPPPAESPKPALEPPPGRVKPSHRADLGPKRIPDRPGGRPR